MMFRYAPVQRRQPRLDEGEAPGVPVYVFSQDAEQQCAAWSSSGS